MAKVKSRRKIKVLPENPLTMKELENETKNYWGYTLNRHGIWGETVNEVNWDLISEGSLTTLIPLIEYILYRMLQALYTRLAVQIYL